MSCMEESCHVYIEACHIWYIEKFFTCCIWRSRTIGNVLSMSSRKGNGYDFSAGLIAVVGCNNGIVGVPLKLCNFSGIKVARFLMGSK